MIPHWRWEYAAGTTGRNKPKLVSLQHPAEDKKVNVHLAAGYLRSQILGCDILYEPDNSPQVICQGLDAEAILQVKAPDLSQDAIWKDAQ
mgnify:CR=1 FL=1